MTDLLKWAEAEAKTARATAADTVYEHDARYQDGRAEAFEELAAQILCCLEKEPSRRPASAKELGRALAKMES